MSCDGYPSDESYDDIVSNSNIFSEKLGSLNSGKTFQLPIMGGSTLDLHLLFVEVTSRGGAERVTKDRKWKEVSCAFNFPASITSASSLLKKYYRMFLQEMEHVYYVQKPASSIQSKDEAVESISPNPMEDADDPVQGVITGKIDDGYLVTVKVGSEEMSGVLYHSPETPSPSQLIMETPLATVPPSQAPPKKRPRLAIVESPKPKCYKTGYNFFFAEQYAIQERAITKKIEDMWNNLSDFEKQVYQDKGLEDYEKIQN